MASKAADLGPEPARRNTISYLDRLHAGAVHESANVELWTMVPLDRDAGILVAVGNVWAAVHFSFFESPRSNRFGGLSLV